MQKGGKSKFCKIIGCVREKRGILNLSKKAQTGIVMCHPIEFHRKKGLWMKKRFLGSLLALMMLLAACTGAPAVTTEEKTAPATTETVATSESAAPLRVVSLKGPTTFGVATMKDIDLTVTALPEEAVAKITKGEADIAFLPANLAAVLYNKSKDLEALAINNYNVLYLVSNEVEDAKDAKTIYSVGKGATPEAILSIYLKEHALAPEVVYVNEPAEALARMKEDKATALLPEPFVTVAKTKVPDLKVLEDMGTALGAKDVSVITGIVVAKKDFVEANGARVDAFLAALKDNVAKMHEAAEETANAVEELGIVPAKIAAKAIPALNLKIVTGKEMEDELTNYYEALFAENPKLVGGEVPASAFYRK